MTLQGLVGFQILENAVSAAITFHFCASEAADQIILVFQNNIDRWKACSLVAGLKNLHLINTSFVHHPEMELPSGMHLDCLTSTSLGRRNTIVPVELLRRAKQARSLLFAAAASRETSVELEAHLNTNWDRTQAFCDCLCSIRSLKQVLLRLLFQASF